MAVAHSVSFFSILRRSPLHPRLYAIAALRGLSSILHQLVQSFLKFVGRRSGASAKTLLLDRVLNALVEKAVYVNLNFIRSLGPIGGFGQVAVHFVLERLGGVVDRLDLFIFRS